MKHLKTEITINATPEHVWNILTDFAAYPEWNSFIIGMVGKAEEGQTLVMKATLNGKVNTFKPLVLKSEPSKHFEWLGSAPFGIFNGQHYFILEPTVDGATKLIHGEKFSGWLRPVIWSMIGKDTEAGFHTMNQELKKRAEG